MAAVSRPKITSEQLSTEEQIKLGLARNDWNISQPCVSAIILIKNFAAMLLDITHVVSFNMEATAVVFSRV